MCELRLAERLFAFWLVPFSGLEAALLNRCNLIFKAKSFSDLGQPGQRYNELTTLQEQARRQALEVDEALGDLLREN